MITRWMIRDKSFDIIDGKQLNSNYAVSSIIRNRHFITGQPREYRLISFYSRRIRERLLEVTGDRAYASLIRSELESWDEHMCNTCNDHVHVTILTTCDIHTQGERERERNLRRKPSRRLRMPVCAYISSQHRVLPSLPPSSLPPSPSLCVGFQRKQRANCANRRRTQFAAAAVANKLSRCVVPRIKASSSCLKAVIWRL